MMNMWDERFSATEYAYGERASEHLQSVLKTLAPGKILFPGEGEGRNALFAALASWEVHAFDGSIEGKKKALELAERSGINYKYSIDSYQDFNTDERYDAIAMIYCHMDPSYRPVFHRKMTSLLKPGGTIILEGFSKAQLGLKSGGPPNLDWLFSKKELEGDFSQLVNVKIEEVAVELDEGQYHRGMAKLIRLVGSKD